MFAQRLRERCSQFAGSVKALLALGFTVALASADYYDAVPLQPLLQQLFGEQAATKLAVFLPIIFGTLRYVSSHRDQDNH